MTTSANIQGKPGGGMEGPLVSVVMTVYNGGTLLEIAMQSILDQTYRNFEFIIVNDCSTDQTESVVSSFSDPRIIYLRNERNLGIGPSRNKAYETVKGKYIATLDADDISEPHRLEKQVEFLEKNPSTAICGTFFQVIDGQGKPGKKFPLPIDGKRVRTRMLLGNCLCNSTIMIRTDVARAHPFKLEFELAEDFELWYRISKFADLHNLPYYSCKYRVHGGSISIQKQDKQLKVLKVVFSMIFKDLDIPFTEDELDIHANTILYKKDHLKDPEMKARMRAWFLKLLAHIEKKQDRYDPKAFYVYVATIWITLAVARRDWKGLAFDPLIRKHPLLYARAASRKALSNI
jgi:glycosyltransferase involved in cell wall biosynthesis